MKSESSSAQHWDDVYGAKSPDEVSWFQRNPSVSLALIEANAVPSQGIVDVGAGASTLVDRLVDRGYSDITVVDISSKALDQVATRLGEKSDSVEFVTANVLTWRPSRHFALWHDRAVFHFLTNPSDQRRYVATCSSAVSPGGVIVLGVFAPDGPAQCSPCSATTMKVWQEYLANSFRLVHRNAKSTSPHGVPCSHLRGWYFAAREAKGQAQTTEGALRCGH